MADATGSCTAGIHIPIRADRLILGFLLQIELRNPQHGQISVITAHFKPAESSTCFKTIKQLLYYHVHHISNYNYHRHVIVVNLLKFNKYYAQVNSRSNHPPPPREHTRAFDLTGYDSAQLIEEVCRDTTRRLMHGPGAS